MSLKINAVPYTQENIYGYSAYIEDSEVERANHKFASFCYKLAHAESRKIQFFYESGHGLQKTGNVKFQYVSESDYTRKLDKAVRTIASDLLSVVSKAEGKI